MAALTAVLMLPSELKPSFFSISSFLEEEPRRVTILFLYVFFLKFGGTVWF